MLLVRRCRRLARDYLPRSWNARLFHVRPGEREGGSGSGSGSDRSSGSDSEGSSESDLAGLEKRGMQLSLATLGLHILDLRAPPSNVKIQGLYSFREEVRQIDVLRMPPSTGWSVLTQIYT